MPGIVLLASRLDLATSKITELFGRPFSQLKMVCITTAANVYDQRQWQIDEIAAVRAAGAVVREFDIAGKTRGAVEAALSDIDVVYIAGGNTYYLLEQMRKCSFAEIIKPLLDRGCHYIGCSAGAVIAGPRIDHIGDMDDPAEATLDDFKGLGLVPFLTMPHLDHPHFGPIAQQQLAALEETCLALRDDQVACVRGSVVEVF